VSNIHPTAVIEDGAQVAASATVGAYCVVGPQVVLGENVVLKSHVVVDGDTDIGEATVVYPFASIGSPTQDLKYHEGEKARLVIGKNNTIREHVTINPGHTQPECLTKIGDNCLLMIAAHVAHDCQLGNGVVMANNATLAGHVIVGDNVVLGGLSAVHQFVRIGAHAMIGGMSGVEKDVIPYGLVKGERAHLAGLNLIGLKRRGFEKSQIQALRQAYDDLFMMDGTLQDKVRRIESSEDLVQRMLDFITEESSHGICQPA